MAKHLNKLREKDIQSTVASESKDSSNHQPVFQLVDNRSASNQILRLQEMADSFADKNSLSAGNKRTLVPAQLRSKNADIQGNEAIQLKKPDKKNRSSMSSEDREARREARFSSTTGGGTTIFDNKEGKLPRASKGTHYIETDSGKGRENRGKRRIVSLVEDSGGRVLKQYVTYDHYSTFEEIR